MKGVLPVESMRIRTNQRDVILHWHCSYLERVVLKDNHWDEPPPQNGLASATRTCEAAQETHFLYFLVPIVEKRLA